MVIRKKVRRSKTESPSSVRLNELRNLANLAEAIEVKNYRLVVHLLALVITKRARA
jgi:hypothetical protein